MPDTTVAQVGTYCTDYNDDNNYRVIPTRIVLRSYSAVAISGFGNQWGL